MILIMFCTAGVSFLEAARTCSGIRDHYSVLWPADAKEAKVRASVVLLFPPYFLFSRATRASVCLHYSSGSELVADAAPRGA